jgi:hypothetical protein
VDAISSYDAGLWPTRYTAHERTSLRVQSKYDRRNVPLKWYWRLLTDEERHGASPDDTYYEQLDLDRRYVGPTGVHLHVEDTSKTKGREKGTTETKGAVQVYISRAECIRLGAVFDAKDTREATLEDEEKAGHDEGPHASNEPFFVPRSGDVFMFRRKHHRILQLEPDYEQSLSPQGTTMAWKGTAELMVMDASVPAVLVDQLIPPTSDPVVPRAQRDVQWPG